MNLLHIAIGQNQVNTFSIKAVVIDSSSFERIPFVSIYKTRDNKGTLSDFNGEFTLEKVLLNDSIIFTYMGYKKLLLIANKDSISDTVYLSPQVLLIDEVIVLADNSILYELVSNVRKTQTNTPEMAKSYFELESYHDKKQLELFQGYYNGTFQGYNVSKLEMKSGRFALAPLSKRIFASTESSKAICMHSIFKSNEYFPVSPFELNERKLRKHYNLQLNSKYKNEIGDVIYVISFVPRKDYDLYFEGKVWIDSLTNNILKTKLKVSSTSVHPFRSIWPEHSLDAVNLEVVKSYNAYKDRMRVKSVNFYYDLTYKSREDLSLQISTQAVLYAFDYSDAFRLPFFEFPTTSNEDYRKLQMLPENDRFWNCMDEFKVENNDEKNAFINDIASINSQTLFNSDTLFKKNFFENPYVIWNGNRILIKGLTADSSRYYDEKRVQYVNRYNLKVQLLLDLNDLCDSVEIITKTVFDPYESFFHFETTKESQAFFNIYFDLIEIERRKLAIELEQVKNETLLIDQLYVTAVNRINQLSDLYFKEVQRGTNKIALKKWNNVVLRELKIDNIELFGVEIK